MTEEVKQESAENAANLGVPCVAPCYNAVRKEVIGDCVLYQGDCTVILPQLPDFDLILTDPPYGIGEAAGKNKSRTKAAKATDYGCDEWDNAPPEFWVFLLMSAKSTNAIFWGGNYFGLPASPCWLVWDKNNGANDFADCELAWTNLEKAVRMIKHRWNGMLQQNMKQKEKRVHPTQKPLPVMEWCLSHVPNAKTVCDPFMGSGTTGMACARKGLNFVGIEREAKYFDIACERITEAYRTKPRLFEATGITEQPKQRGLF
jgi:site-specific DNA-methyltransferase (adenine-specific)/modification methylase